MKQINPFMDMSRYVYKSTKIMFAFLLVQQVGIAQNPTYVDNIGFEITESSKIVLPEGTQYDDIHEFDIASLEYQEKTTYKSKYFDDEGNPQTEITLTNAINFYEDWQGLATKWIMNQDGTTSYKQEDSQGAYIEYKYQAQSERGEQLYEGVKTLANETGFIASLVYPQQLEAYMEEEGIEYIVGPDGSLIRQNNGSYVTYRLATVEGQKIGIISEVNYFGSPGDHENESPNVEEGEEGGDGDEVGDYEYPEIPDVNDLEVANATTSVFDIDLCGELFLSSRIGLTKVKLFNGLCAKSVIEEYYSDYDFECNDGDFKMGNDVSEMTVGTSQSDHERSTFSSDLTVYPNPLSNDMISISLPTEIANQDYELTITNLSGIEFLERKGKLNDAKLQLNVGASLSSDGIYIISIISENQVFTKNFYYLKN